MWMYVSKENFSSSDVLVWFGYFCKMETVPQVIKCDSNRHFLFSRILKIKEKPFLCDYIVFLE